MHYGLIDRFKIFAIHHRKTTVMIFTGLLLGVLLNLVRVSFSQRMEIENNNFDEIQNLIVQIKSKDRDIYNNLDVVKVKKEVRGMDVSAWQGEIDWDKVKEDDIDFVMIRCGVRNLAEEGTLHVDSQFERNIKEANRVGIPVGIYFYSSAINEIEVMEEASFVLNLIKDYEITYPIAYDFENFNQYRAEGIDDARISRNALRFLDYVRGHGYYAVLYGNITALSNHYDLNYFKEYDIWLAQYNDVATYDGEYSMWQYTNYGTVDGIRGYVDLNKSYYSYEKK